MNISGLANQDALRGYSQIGRTAFLGQVGGAAQSNTAVGPVTDGDRSTFSAELGESEGGADQLLAAWGAGQSAAASPPLAISGIEPGAKAGFSVNASGVSGMEPGMQLGGVMMGPVLRT